MKRFLLLMAAVALVPACGGGGGGGGRGGGGEGSTVIVTPPPGMNNPPTVIMTSPGGGTSVPEGSMVVLQADASDPDGAVTRVEFLDGNNSLGSDTQAPFSVSWTAVGLGIHALRAMATDSSGATTTSAAVSVVVTANPTQPPSSPPVGTLQGVFFADVNHGWVAGESGGMWATANGGTTWTHQDVPTTFWLERVQFLDLNTGWAVGGRGGIFKTTNGGLTWAMQEAGTLSFLSALSFVDVNNGWVSGQDNTVLRTTDGGATWTAASPPPGLGETWNAISFISPLKGWVGGSLHIARTSDGGATWTTTESRFNASGTSNEATFADARFASPTLGMMAGAGQQGELIFMTRDGGLSWTQQLYGHSPANIFFRGIAFGDASHWWAVGDLGSVLATTDAGITWIDRSPGVVNPLKGVWFVNASTGWVVGDHAMVLRTTDGGLSWTILSHGS